MQNVLVSNEFRYSVREEIANSIIHGIGVLLAVAGLVLLILKGAGYLPNGERSGLAVMSYIIFTVSMILTFLASTLYHAIQHQGAKRIFRLLDHGAIYLLIAGTYTPICLLGLGGKLGWILFSVEWGLATTGIILNTLNLKFIKKIKTGLYVAMGWAIAVCMSSLISSVSTLSFILLLAGGVAYTLGIIWYKSKGKGSHAVWHTFVLSGAVGQWLSVWYL